MDFKNIINELFKDLSELIKMYEVLDNPAPFNSKIFKEIKSIFNSLQNDSIKSIEAIEKQKNVSTNRFKSIIDDYHKQINKLSTQLNNSKKEIKDKYEKEINKINIDINNEKKEFKKIKDEIDLDIEFDKQSIEQHIEIFENEYKENNNRYSYLYSVAKESYNNNVIHYNNILDSELTKLKSKYKSLLTVFDKDTESIIERYNVNIEKNTLILEQRNNDYNDALAKLKDDKRNETKLLNDTIRELVNKKNKKIDDARINYSTAQNNSTIEKENKKQDYQAESQRISRDFILNTNELDEINAKAKSELDENINNSMELQLEYAYNLHLQQEAEISKVIKSTDSSTSKKMSIRNINRTYYKLLQQDKAKTNDTIDQLSNNYSTEYEKNIYSKKLLDLDRSSAIKRLTEKEIKDNKYYQEINNLYENDMNYSIQLANHIFTTEANNIRLDSSITNLEIEKELDELEADHQKKIESIINSNKKNKLEIDVALEINKLIHKFEEEKYQRKINYHTVSNLLEIEKCKVLDTYNKKQYELNVLNNKLIFDYSINKVKISNERFENENKKKIEIKNKVLDNNICFAGYNIMNKSIDEKYEYKLVETENKYQNNISLHNVLHNRYQIELKNINYYFSILTILIKNVEKYTNELFSIVVKIISDGETFNLLKSFVVSYNKLCNNFYVKILNEFKNNLGILIDNRLDFEGEFKFNNDFSILRENYSSGLSILNNEKNELVSKKEDNLNRVEELKTLIFRLESSITYKKIKTDKTKYNEIKQNIKNNYKEISLLNSEIIELDKNIKYIDFKLAQFENKSKKEFNNLKDLQFNNALPYHKLKENINFIIDAIIYNISTNITNNYNEITSDLFLKYLENVLSSLASNNDDIIKRIYYIIKKFTNDVSENTHTDLSNIEIESYNSKNEIHKLYKNDKERFNNKVIKETRTKTNELIRIKEEYLQLVKYYNKLTKDNESNYQNNINELLLNKKESTNQFYIELYAICDNAKDIEKDFHDFLKNMNKKFEEEKSTIIQEATQKKKEYDKNLAEYIKTRNDLIHHLPIAVKLQTKSLIEETKNKNKDIDINLADLKIKYASKRKNIKKNITIIEAAYQSNIDKINLEHKILINKERKNHLVQLHKIKYQP
ncbi:MAG: hypothetical protein ACI35S_05150 [Anaeroplasma sp.]